jgi:hypothetical protein
MKAEPGSGAKACPGVRLLETGVIAPPAIQFVLPADEQAASICDRDRWLASNLISSGLKMFWKITMNQLGSLPGRKVGLRVRIRHVARWIATLQHDRKSGYRFSENIMLKQKDTTG